jgi:hypothetical protein
MRLSVNLSRICFVGVSFGSEGDYFNRREWKEAQKYVDPNPLARNGSDVKCASIYNGDFPQNISDFTEKNR